LLTWPRLYKSSSDQFCNLRNTYILAQTMRTRSRDVDWKQSYHCRATGFSLFVWTGLEGPFKRRIIVRYDIVPTRASHSHTLTSKADLCTWTAKKDPCFVKMNGQLGMFLKIVLWRMRKHGFVFAVRSCL
jgi:hypothetical protein